MPCANGSAVVIDKAGFTSIETAPVLAVALRLSETATAKLNVPEDPPTVPVIMPAEDKERPVGKDPEAKLNVYGAVPPVTQEEIF